FLAVARNGGFSVVAGRVGQALQVRAVGFRGVDVVGVVDGPDVTFGIIGLGRTLRGGRVRGGKQNAIAGGKEVTARGASLACADQVARGRFAVRRADGDGIDLVAGDITALMLED